MRPSPRGGRGGKGGRPAKQPRLEEQENKDEAEADSDNEITESDAEVILRDVVSRGEYCTQFVHGS